MTLETPPDAQQLLQGLLKCRDCGIHMITVAEPDGRPTHYACRTMLNNETDTCSIPKMEIRELDRLILEKALETPTIVATTTPPYPIPTFLMKASISFEKSQSGPIGGTFSSPSLHSHTICFTNLK